MSTDSVVLEVAILRLPIPEEGASDEFWKVVDEQQLPLETRRKLEQNGLRCGTISGQLPPELNELIETGDTVSRLAGDESTSTSDLFTLKRLQNRAGRRSKIVTSNVRDELIVLMPEQGRIMGQTYTQAQCLISAKSFPRGDGQVRLELIPEIEHGQPKQRWVGQPHEGTFRLDTNAERAIFDNLRIEPNLAPGQTFVLTCSPHLKGLGRHFFADGAANGKEQRLLLIRVAQTQLDDLFAPEKIPESLTTSAE